VRPYRSLLGSSSIPPPTEGATIASTASPGLDAVAEQNRRLYAENSAAFEALDIEASLALWDPDGVYSTAYEIEGFPSEIRGFLAACASLEQRDVRFHQTIDPQVFLVEWEWHAVLHDGTAHSNRYAARARVQDGRFAEFHEYYGQLAHLALLRQLGLVA
jgi:ketosteroid isomerase-like protein